MAWRKKKPSNGTHDPARSQIQRHEATLYEALAYFDSIKIRYDEHPEVFVHFLDILDDYKGGRTDYIGVIRRCSVLFADSLDFIEAFNSFMPTGYHIECGADNNCLIVIVTIPEGTRIDTRINLGSGGTGPFISEINTRFGPGQSATSASPVASESQTLSSVPEITDIQAPGLQVLADLAARPSIALTARDALQAKHEPSIFAPPSGNRQTFSAFQPRDVGYTFRPNDGASTFFPARKARRIGEENGDRPQFGSPPQQLPRNHSTANRTIDESSVSESSPEVASPQSSFSQSHMGGISPVHNRANSGTVFQMQTRFAGRRGSEPSRKLQGTQDDHASRKGSTSSNAAGSLAGREFAIKAEGLKLEDPDSPRTHEGPKPGNKSRSTKRLQSGQAKTGRTSTTRAFPCPFAVYGCPATFGSKNEWKRHVNTQHMRLGYWRCDLCDQGKGKPNDFNRKDLFIQHIRRMHSSEKTKPVKAKAAGTVPSKNDPEEQMMAAAANRCFHQLHQPPHYCACNFCDQTFQGEGCWDERLEHVGRHIETMVKDGEVVDPLQWKTDLALEEWLIREKLLRRSGEGWIVESNGQWLAQS